MASDHNSSPENDPQFAKESRPDARDEASKEHKSHDHNLEKHDHDHDHDHGHSHAEAVDEIDTTFNAADAEGYINPEVLRVLQRCAEEGWRCNVKMKTGDFIEQLFITAADWENGAIKAEKIGERHLKPRLIWLKDIVAAEPDWT